LITRTIAIIGAGFAGLATGCCAQMNGYSTHIYEHNSKPGGVAAAWRRNGYLIDGRIQRRMHTLGSKPEWADKISALEDIDFFGRQTLLEYAGYLSMSDEEFKEYCKLNREIGQLLKSKLASSPRAKRKS
jgi:2-polyprenyl-6-methoxyphenol hydroxylase-like FAD-dependent oxidoreductase